MFITANEAKMFQLTALASVEALCLSLNATMSYSLIAYRWARPKVEKAAHYTMVAGLWTIALGMVCRDWYEILKPKFMAWVDGVVESGYGRCQGGVCPAVLPELPEDEEFYPESERPDGTHAVFVADVYAPVAAKAMPETRLSILDVEKPVSKMNIRELRAYAVRQGIKGAGNMTKARILELMGV